jgi:hypothetical protein
MVVAHGRKLRRGPHTHQLKRERPRVCITRGRRYLTRPKPSRPNDRGCGRKPSVCRPVADRGVAERDALDGEVRCDRAFDRRGEATAVPPNVIRSAASRNRICLRHVASVVRDRLALFPCRAPQILTRTSRRLSHTAHPPSHNAQLVRQLADRRTTSNRAARHASVI